MNRFVMPAVTVVGVAMAVVGAALVAVQEPSAPVTTEDLGRVSVTCPTGEVVVAGSPGSDVTWTTLSRTPADAGPAVGRLSVETISAPEPVVVSAPRADPLAATTRVEVPSGADRGLSMASCVRPGAAHWFAGVTSTPAGSDSLGQAELVLINTDAVDAAVDVAAYGADGPLIAPGSRGIVVPSRTGRVVPLGPMVSASQPVAVHVSTSQGRVVALIRQRWAVQGRPSGSDWLPPTVEPAFDVVIPGIPPGAGSRELALVNPGERTASVALQVLGEQGPTAIAGLETLTLPPRTSRTVPLTAGLNRAAAGLRLRSDQPVTAAVVSGSGGAVGSADSSVQVATPPGASALAADLNRTARLHLVLADSPGASPEPGDDAELGEGRPVRVIVSDGTQIRRDSTLNVPPGANVTLTLPALDRALIRIESSVPVHASLAVRTRLRRALGTASVAGLPGPVPVPLPPLVHDPRPLP